MTASAGQRRGDVEIRNYLQAGSRSLVFDLSIAHDRFGSSSHVQQNGCVQMERGVIGVGRGGGGETGEGGRGAGKEDLGFRV